MSPKKYTIICVIFSVFFARDGLCVDSPFVKNKVRFKINWTGGYVVCVFAPSGKENLLHPSDHIADINIAHNGKVKKLIFSKPYLVTELRSNGIAVCENYSFESKGYYDFFITRFDSIKERYIKLDLLPAVFVK